MSPSNGHANAKRTPLAKGGRQHVNLEEVSRVKSDFGVVITNGGWESNNYRGSVWTSSSRITLVGR